MKKMLLPFFLLVALQLTAQDIDTVQAGQFLEQARKIVKDERQDKAPAIRLAEQALAVFEATPYLDRIGACHELLGGAFMKSNRYQASILAYYQAIEAYRSAQGDHRRKLIQAYDKLSLAYYRNAQYRQQDSVLQIAFQYLANTTVDLPTRAHLFDSKAVALMEQVQYDSAIHYYEQALDLHRQRDTTQQAVLLDLADNRFNAALVYHRNGRYAAATPLILQAIRYAEQADSREFLAAFYSGLGLNYNKRGDLERAIDTYNKGIALTLQLPHHENYTLATLYNNLGVVYRKSGACDKAFDIYQKALAIDKSLHRQPTPFQADILTNIGACHLDLGQLETAEQYFLEALSIRTAVLPPNHPRLGINNGALGLIAQDKEEYPKAIQYFEKANAIYIANFGEQHLRPANGYMAIAFCHYKMGDLDQSINYYQKALEANNYHQNEPNRFQLILADNVLFTCLREISRSYFDRYELNGDPEALKQATWYLEESIAATEFFKSNFQSPASKKRLMAQSYSNYVNLILLYQTYYENTQEAGYLEQAFATAEAAKSNYLLEHLSDWSAQCHAAIPDSLLETATQLETEIAQLEKVQFEASTTANDSLLQNTNIALYDQKERYLALKAQLLQDFPDYSRLKFFQPTLTLSDVQKSLHSDEALIEYVLGEEILYTFLIRPQSAKLIETPIDAAFLDTVNLLRESLYAYWLLPTDQRSNEQLQASTLKYVAAARALHQKLLAPLGELPPSLLIIPSGALGYLPFEVLLTEQPKDPMQFKDLPYLLRQHRISYNFSAALWQEMSGKRTTSGNAYLLAPSFQEVPQLADMETYRRDNLGPLRFNTEEVTGIQALIGGQSWTGAAATKAQFLEIAPEARLLHFATHAKLDDRDEDFSYLAFSASHDSLPVEKLYIRELYAQKIPAELVVLSACETGVGSIQQGEGIISLARGFAYAGAGSIVTSLWAVDDQSTARLMTDFYARLKQGDAKDAALRQVKLNYLAAAGDQLEAHPFYWAPFILLGDAEAIALPFRDQRLPGWVLLVSGLVLAGFGYYLSRKRASSRVA